MSFLRDLATGEGCDADIGSSSANNPLRNMTSTFLGDNRNAMHANEIDNLIDDNVQQQQKKIPNGAQTFGKKFGNGKASANLQFSPQEQMKARGRSEMLARHLFADRGEKAVEQQAQMFLSAFNVPMDSMTHMQQQNHPSMMMNFKNASSMGKSNQKFTLADDIDIAADGEQDELGGDLDQFIDDAQNVDVHAAYAKYLEYMKQTLSLDHIQKTTEEYKFSVVNNQFTENPKAFEVGVQFWKQGDLIKAISAFEAAVFQNNKNADAWRLLGVCHAECDDDTRAINALAHAVDMDPQNLNALLDLGVCYTNELNKMRALVYLKTWLQSHPAYMHIVQDFDMKKQQNEMKTPEDPQDYGHLYNYFHFHQEVLGMFKQASQQAQDDADLFAVLGVLYNISHDFDSAMASFKHAIQLRPADYSLWNKLGATQANSARSNEAVDCYRQALKLKPNYIRAWINLGIAYANQKKYPDAIKYYLRSLNMCPRAENVWQYLGMAFTCMDRPDLVEMCKFKDVERFRNEFPF